MDGTFLIALASGLGSGCVSFVAGLAVCGPRLEICWTERHPREIAKEVQAGTTNLKALTPHARQLVLAELARMNNGLTVAESSQFIALTGVADRFVGQEPAWAHDEADQR